MHPRQPQIDITARMELFRKGQFATLWAKTKAQGYVRGKRKPTTRAATRGAAKIERQKPAAEALAPDETSSKVCKQLLSQGLH